MNKVKQQQLTQEMIDSLTAIVGKKNVRTSPHDLKVFGKDWTTVYDPCPSLVLLPTSTQEVSAIVKYCAKHHLKIVPSGGRTGLSGGAVAMQGEIVLSLQQMDKIIAIDKKSMHAVVEAGVTTQALQDAASAQGVMFALDMSSKGSSCIGGNIATDAGGTKFVRYGGARAQVLGLEVVLADGRILHLNGELHKNNTGYALRHLFIGSEGTLGIVTQAVMKLFPLPLNLTTVFFAVENIANILQVLEILHSHKGVQVSAFEMMPHRCLELVINQHALPNLFAARSDYYVLVELDGDSTEMELVLENIFNSGLAKECLLAQSSAEQQSFWRYRESITETLTSFKVVLKGDISVPVQRLASFIFSLLRDCKSNADDRVEMVFFGHVGDGNLHINYLSNFAEARPLLDKLEQRMHQLVSKFSGSISAEHGIGLRKKQFLALSRSKEEIDLMKRIKRALDPQGILNPNKIF